MTTHEEAMAAAVTSGVKIGSGFATNEPHKFYATLWDHIQQQDLHDIEIRQALFMAPHKLCLGDAMSAKGMFNGFLHSTPSSMPVLKNIALRANQATKKIEGLNRLIDHYRELKERRIRFVSPFIGATQNIVIPTNPITRVMFPDYVGRNQSRMGIVQLQACHFPDAVDAMAWDENGGLNINLLPLVMTPPNEEGELSHGPANGATNDFLEIAVRDSRIRIILYVNEKYPFTRAWGDSANTIHIDQFKRPAKEGRLWVVEDDSKIPGLPKGAFDNPAADEAAIAEHVVNHMELHPELVNGRAIQVGIGGTGVLAMKRLLDSNWVGRSYSEMLEPFTLQLFEAGKITGSHYVERNGLRTPLDDKIVATFTMAEEGSDFYSRLDNNPHIVLPPASRVVISEGFCGGLGINNILGIDFHGHVNSGGRDKNHYSGIGGAAQIMRGLGRGGVAYLCLKSTHRTPEGKLRSSIFPYLPLGTPIGLIGPDIMGTRGAHFFLVTEHGVAKISAMPQDDFIKKIISVAHPDFREQLKSEAWEEFRVSC